MAVRQISQEAQETTLRTETPVAVPVTPTATTTEDAAAVRVTPRELVDAITTLEAEQRRQADYRAETIALGEAVEQLTLTMTPEQLLAQIERRRAAGQVNSGAAKSVTAPTPPKLSSLSEAEQTLQAVQEKWSARRSRGLARLKAAGVAASLLANAIFIVSSLSTFSVSSPAPARIGAINDPALESNLSALKMSGWNVGNLENGVKVYVNRDGIYQLTHGEEARSVHTLSARGSMRVGSTQWLITKENGQIFVQGYASGDVTGALTDFTSVKVNDNQHPVKLPIEQLRDVNAIAGTEPVTIQDSNGVGGAEAGQAELLSVPAPADARRP